ncbi:MAG: hypothetical protein K9M75_06825 [Phycisphaerae bacterium]|nr:hypothetical protein [Phycisphaerae bacterium]
MAGLNFIFSFDNDVTEKASAYQQALSETLFEDTHHVETVFETDQVLSSFTGYDNYPARTFETDGIKYYVEGCFFNLYQETADKAIASFSKRLFAGDQTAKKDLTDWLLTVDAEFLVFAYSSADKRILIFNDVFGSLPCYMHQTDWGVAFSRSFLFVSKFVAQKQLDQMAMAQFLTLRYTIGDRTYLNDVYSIKPAQLISIETDTRTMSRQVLHVFNFEKKKYRFRSTEKNALESAKLFAEGCRRRTDPDGKNVVLLSGGLDSRAVAAGLSKAGCNYDALTQIDLFKTAENDFEIARLVASAVGVTWKDLQAEPVIGKALLRTLKMKGGFVYLGRTFLLQINDRIVADYGHKARVFTGLGGDKVARDTRKKGVWTINQIIDRLLRNESVMPLDTSLKLAGVSKEDFYKELRKEIAAYPEKRISQKSVHLNFYMRNIKWHFEGTDRQRNFFWTASPFFSIDFFHYIMNCPDRQKTYLRFYIHFLDNLNRSVSDLPYAVNYSLRPVSIANCRNLSWYCKCCITNAWIRIRRFPNPVRFVIRKIKKLFSKPAPGSSRKFVHSENIVKIIEEQISNCSQKGDFLNWTAIRDVLENCEKYNNESMYILLTVVSIAEQLATGKSSLEKYKESDFGSYNSIRRDVDPTSIS